MADILVLDDDPDLAALLAGASLPGHRVERAATRAEARRLLLSGQAWDLALVAVDGDSPFDLAFFRELPRESARLPRIALTRSRDLGFIRRLLNEGAADFLHKPVAWEELATTVARVARVCEERRRAWRNERELSAIRREIEIAREIQRRIMPEVLPRIAGCSLAARSLPARAMGGDFLDLFALGPGLYAVLVADVAGKGIPAAFGMAVVHTLMRATLLSGTHGAGACLGRVNELLVRHHLPGMVVSAFLGILDVVRHRLRWSSAGHPPVLMHEAGASVTALTGAEGVILGVEEGLEYPESEHALKPGQTLFCYTDGLTEAWNPERRQFSEEGLREVLARHGALPVAALGERLVAEVAAFQAGEPQSDDITWLVLRREGEIF